MHVYRCACFLCPPQHPSSRASCARLAWCLPGVFRLKTTNLALRARTHLSTFQDQVKRFESLHVYLRFGVSPRRTTAEGRDVQGPQTNTKPSEMSHTSQYARATPASCAQGSPLCADHRSMALRWRVPTYRAVAGATEGAAGGLVGRGRTAGRASQSRGPYRAALRGGEWRRSQA